MVNLLRELRDMVPIRPLTQIEAMRVAELQATRLLALSGIEEPPVPEEIITGLPRVQVTRVSTLPVSGLTQWSRGRWLIALNATEAGVRQRFSLFHEAKHMFDHPFINVLYPAQFGISARDRAEQVCDLFAADLLMPRAWVKRVYCDERVQGLPALSRRFDVSQAAMRYRLTQIGLIDQPPRCQVMAVSHPVRQKEPTS